LYVDYENVIDTVYANSLEVDTVDSKKWLLSMPNSLEEGIDLIGALVYTGEIGLVIVDSVAAMTPEAELESSMSNNTIGSQARGMGKSFRKLVGVLARTKTTCIFINQMRDKIGGFGVPYTTPGGKALKFYASIRIKTSVKKSDIDKEWKESKFKIVKNKTSIHQGLQTSYQLLPGIGYSKEYEAFEIGIDLGLVKKVKRHYVFIKKEYSFDQLMDVLKNVAVKEKLYKLWEKHNDK